MVDEGLRDGDRLIVKPRTRVADGQTVVAEVDGKLTVKRVFRDGRGRMRLKPANPEMLPLTVPVSRFRIVGVLVGVFRRHEARGAQRVQPSLDAVERTLDAMTQVIDQSVRQAETVAAVRSGAARARFEGLAQSLRTLRDCYVDARTPKLRAALPVTLPLLAITALSWVAVNADVGLATRRAIALATSPHALTDPQRAHLHAYFGQRAMDERHPEVAAPHYEQAFREGGNPRRALLAAEAWLLAGNEDAARAAIAAARGRGPLSSELEADARQIESHLAPSDSSRTP